MNTTSKPRPLLTLADVEHAARGAHELFYRLLGDGYATANEMETHRTDPFCFFELVRDAVIVALGVDLERGAIMIECDAVEITAACKRHAATLEYIAHRRRRTAA